MNEEKRYRIDEREFYQEPLAWLQEKWLAEYVFRNVDAYSLNAVGIMVLLQTHAPLLLAICLIEQGQTRAQKCEAGVEPVRELAHWFECHLTPAVIHGWAADFFVCNPPENLWLLADFHRVAEALPSAEPTGSSAPSVSSPMAIAAGATGS